MKNENNIDCSLKLNRNIERVKCECSLYQDNITKEQGIFVVSVN